MEENSDSQMETDVSSTTQDLPSPEEVVTPTSSMEISVEIAETTVELEEAQDQSIDSNTPEMESPTVTINIISPTQKIVIDCPPDSKENDKHDKVVVYESPHKTASFLKSPTGSTDIANSSPSVLQSSPSVLQSSPVKTSDKSPVKALTMDKSPAKNLTLDKSIEKVLILNNSPTKPITIEKPTANKDLTQKRSTVENQPTADNNSPAKITMLISPIKGDTGKKENLKTEEINNSDQIKEPELVPEKDVISNISFVDSVSLIEPSTDSQTGSETVTSEVSEKERNKSLSRELKSLINSAKESKIISECTQLTSKTRKSRTPLETSLVDGKKVQTRRSSANSQESESSEKSDKSPFKRSMRSQNPEFVTKQKQFLNSVTGKKEEEATDGEVDEVKSKEEEATSTPPKKKLEEKVIEPNKLRYDSYCWRCHWPAESAANEKAPKPVSCTVCPRTYHFKCLTGSERTSAQSDKSWVCPECFQTMQAESSETRSPAMRKISLGMLCDLLKYALKRMMEVNGVEPFSSPVDRTVFREYDKFVVHPMDLSLVRANIEGGYYGSTEAFAADVQWILHNSIIFNTLQSKMTAAARALLRSCRAEMGEIEACPECYAAAHARRATWFTDVCGAPHILLWAKLKGFPYWPAKGMSVSPAGLVDVRFFGAHDRAWVPAKDCYLFSEKDPNNFKAKRQDIIDSMNEAEEHIRNISRKFSKFVYPAYKVQFDPAKITEQLKMMIPGYEPVVPAAFKAKPITTTPATDSLKRRKSMHKDGTEYSPGAAAQKNRRKSLCKDHSPGPVFLRNRRKSQMKEEESTASLSTKSDVPEESAGPSKKLVVKDSPGPASMKNKKLPSKDSPEAPGPASVKNKRKSLAKAESEKGSDESPRPKRKMAEKVPSDEVYFETGSDKTEKPKEDVETRKRRRSVLEEANELTVMDNKKPCLETLALKAKGSIVDPMKPEETATTSAEKEPEKVKENAATPKVKEKEMKERTPNSRSRGSTPKIVLRQVPKNKTPKSSEKPIIIAREKSTSSEKEKSSEEKTKKAKKSTAASDSESSKSDGKTTNSGKASPVPKVTKSVLGKSTASPKQKDEENTSLATIAKKKSGALNIPLLISNVRSLCRPPTTAPKPKLPEAINNENANTKEATEKLQRLRNDGEKNLVGTVGVRAFARMTSPPADNLNKVTVEVKAEPIDVDEPERQSEKIDLLSSFKLRPVGAATLRDVRMNKPAPARRPSPRAEVRPRAKKTFPQPRKADECLNGKNSMVYIPIQPPVTAAPATRPPPPRLNGPANPPPLRQNSPIVVNSVASSLVNTVTSPLMSVLARGAASPLGARGPAPTVGAVPASVHTVPFITSVNGQWTFSLQPVMAVGAQDGSSSQQLNGLDRPIPIPSSISNPPPLVASELPALAPLPAALPAPLPAPLPAVAVPSLTTNMIQPVQPPIMLPNMNDKSALEEMPRLQLKPCQMNPVDPATPLGEAPMPCSAGPVTAKLNLNAVKLADFFRNLLQESLEKADDPRAQLTAARKHSEMLTWRYSQQLKEIKHNHELQIAEMRTSFEKERARAVSEAAKAAQAQLDAALKQAKSKQWCANCMQEAQFYCCWNTSYCDYPCQRAHWAQHYGACAQHRNKEDRTIPAAERLQPPEFAKSPPAAQRTVGGKVMPPRIAPTLPSQPRSSIIVSMVDDPSGNPTVKCVGTYKPPGSGGSPLLLNKQLMNKEENAQKKVVTSGGYLIVGASAPTSVASVIID